MDPKTVAINNIARRIISSVDVENGQLVRTAIVNIIEENLDFPIRKIESPPLSKTLDPSISIAINNFIEQFIPMVELVDENNITSFRTFIKDVCNDELMGFVPVTPKVHVTKFLANYSFADCAKDPQKGGIPIAELKKLAQQMGIDDTLGKYQICQAIAKIFGMEPNEPIAKTMIGKKRALIGKPSAMAGYASKILQQPEGVYEPQSLSTQLSETPEGDYEYEWVPGKTVTKGKLQRAKRVFETRFKTDVKTKTGLCSDPKSDMYRDELVELANELDLPGITKEMTKKDICQMLAKYVEASQIEKSEDLAEEEAEKKLLRTLHMSQRQTISAGVYHSLGLLNDGTIIGWGSDDYGQIDVPRLPPGQKWVDIRAGGPPSATLLGVSLGLLSDGTVYAWGDGGYEQTRVPALPPGRKFVAISAGGTHSLGLLDDGTAIGWGISGDYGQRAVPPLVPGLKWVAISAGLWHSLGLLDDGTVVGWGDNMYGQAGERPFLGHTHLGQYPEDDEMWYMSIRQTNAPAGKAWIAISAGEEHSLGLLSDGKVIGWGKNDHGQTDVPVEPGRKYRDISAGGTHSLGLLNDGTVIGWGNNDFGQIDVPLLPPGRKWVAISAGGSHSLGQLDDGTVVGWGNNVAGQTDVPALRPGQKFALPSAE